MIRDVNEAGSAVGPLDPDEPTSGADHLAQTARTLSLDGVMDSAVAHAVEACLLWRDQGDFEAVHALADELLHRMGVATAQVQDLRFALVRVKAETYLRSGNPVEGEALLQTELSSPGSRYSLENQLPLISLQAAASNAVGNAVRTRLLLAEAVALSSESDPAVEIHSTALALAITNQDMESIRTLSSELAELSDGDETVDMTVRFATVYGMAADGEFEDADLSAEGLYLDARRSADHASAYRALYMRAAFEGIQFGPTDRCMEFFEQVLWLADQRGDPNWYINPFIAMVEQCLARGDLRSAQLALNRMALHSQEPSAVFAVQQSKARVALFTGDLDQADALLQANELVSDQFGSVQYAGVQLLLQSEYARRRGYISESLDYAQQAVDWLGEILNDSAIREAVLEACRVHVAAGDTAPCAEWIQRIDRSRPANDAYAEACEGVVAQDPSRLAIAAEKFSALHYKYESMCTRLEIARITGAIDRALAAEADAVHANWIAVAAVNPQ